VAGEATGSALVLEEPLSFWGGLDPATGRLVDPRHPQRGVIITGRVLVMPSGRGSSSSSSILAESIRLRTAPAAIVLAEPDQIVALGAIVARELYGVRMPVVTVQPEASAEIQDGVILRVVGPIVTVPP
jgi:predicted aconitase with swiveling domain